jgi:hypothetical protein
MLEQMMAAARISQSAIGLVDPFGYNSIVIQNWQEKQFCEISHVLRVLRCNNGAVLYGV